jgi:arylsulfatase
MLVAHGDQGGGYALYVEDGRLFFAFNGYGDMTVIDGGEVAAGTDRISLRMEWAGNFRCNAVISIGGTPVGEAPDLPVLMAMAPFEGIDVGIDRRSPVSWEVYERHGVFPYSGTLHGATYRPGELAADAGVRFLEFMRETGTRFE